MSWLKTVTTAAALNAVMFAPTFAGENLDQIKSAGVIKIGTEGTYAPFTFHDSANKLSVSTSKSVKPWQRSLASKPSSLKASGMV